MKTPFPLLLLLILILQPAFSQNNIALVSQINYQTLHNAELNDCWGYVDETGIEYALVGTTKGTSVVSLEDPANPVEVFWSPGSESIWRELQVYSDYAYITTEAEDGLLIIDLSPLPASTVLPTTYYFGDVVTSFTTAHDLFVGEDGYAFICGTNHGNGGIIILDVFTDPMNPLVVGTFDTWYCHDAFAQGNLLYGAHIADGFLSIIDITDKSNPVLINTQETPNSFTHNVGVTTNDQYAVTTDEVAGAFLTLYDVSNPNTIQEVDRIQSSPGLNIIPHNAFILHDSLIVSSYYTDGITIHDMTRPHNLVEIAAYDTHPLENGSFNGSWGAYPFFPSGIMLASDISEGLFVLQPTIVPACYYEGLVRDASNLSNLADVTVTIDSNPQIDISDLQGKWAVGTVVSGTQNVTFEKVAYFPQTVSVSFVNGQLVLDTIDLVPIPPFSLTVVVEEMGTGNPIVGADIRITVPELSYENQSNGLGERQFDLHYPGTSAVTVGKWGYQTSCQDMILNASTGTVTVQLEKGYYDDFEFDFGWSTAATASTGLWERGIPQGSDNLGTTYFDADFDCGIQAFVTGNSVTTNGDFDDIDAGRVTLYSPQFDISTEIDPYLHYSRWYYSFFGVEPLDDTLEIYLSNGITTMLVDSALPNNVNYSQWIQHSIHVSDFMTATATMQLIVTVSDDDPDVNVTEAGIDFFFVANQNFVEINETNQSAISIYPNPVSDLLSIKGELNSSYFITDLTGKKIGAGQLLNSTHSIDCSEFKNGIYLITIGNSTHRFVKQ